MSERELPRNEELEEAVLRKLDGGMRRLLRLSDAEIRERIARDREKAVRLQRRIAKEIEGLPRKLAEDEREVVARFTRARGSELLPRRDLAAVILERRRPVRIRAVVRFTGNREDLEAMGIAVRSQAQDVFTVVGTRQQLSDLASQPACRRLRTPRMLFPTVEHASAQAEIANVHNARPANPTGFQGNGILVGIIDSPLDVTHHGFQDPLGAHDSRVLYYWAQSTHTEDATGETVEQLDPPGQTPQQFTNAAAAGTRPDFGGLDYGRLYTRAQINTALGLANPYGVGDNQICCEPRSTREHGTHCAGIAVGSGHEDNWNTDPTHVGAAPEATIVYVRSEAIWATALDTGGTLEDALLDTIDFCLRAAQFHNMPIVISVSQGTSFGPHNGLSDFDLARDNFLNSFNRRSIVWAAGNDNDSDGYRRGSVASGNGTDAITLTVRRAGSFGRVIDTPVWLDIWYTNPVDLEYRVTYGSSSPWRTSGQDYSGTLNGRDIEVERDMEPGGGLRGIRVYVDNARTDEAYTIDLRNPHASQTANYHAWSGLQGWWAELTGPTANEMTLHDTGCGKSILTVGACAKIRPPNPASGEQIAAYSGAGPTVDGRIKPEIVAVGGTRADRVMSAKSDEKSGYVGMFGTSMATPLVAGAVALLLEEYTGLGHNLNQDTIKTLLTQYANRLNLNLDPTQPGYVAEERNRYGYGRLRMIEPIDHILPPTAVDLWIRTAADDYGEEPYPGGCFCGAPDIRVFVAETNNETTNITWGDTYDVRVTVRNSGDSAGNGATLRLKYTLPHAAPSDWFEAEDSSNNKLVRTINVPAMDSVEELFQWRPEAAELGAPAGTTHFCLLAEVDHGDDQLQYPAPTTAGGSAWSTNIKSTNNVALRNLHIQ